MSSDNPTTSPPTGTSGNDPSNAKTAAELLGRQAYREGKKERENPFGTADFIERSLNEAWAMGWQGAHADDKRKVREEATARRGPLVYPWGQTDTKAAADGLCLRDKVAADVFAQLFPKIMAAVPERLLDPMGTGRIDPSRMSVLEDNAAASSARIARVAAEALVKELTNN